MGTLKKVLFMVDAIYAKKKKISILKYKDTINLLNEKRVYF